MEKLIEAVNKLHHICNEAGLNQEISLPRIVVVGDQSAGKSSILESFVGRPCLPRGDGIVTRCPINLQLINIQEPHEVYIGDAPKILEDFIEFPLLNGAQQFFDDFELLPELIEEEVARLAGNGKNITEKEIIVKIYSKSVPTLTVIDLPGIIKNPVVGQPTNIEEYSKKLILKYIQDDNTIILAVMMATNEIASAESVKLARMYDQDLSRTILVVTKVDLGVEREKLRDTLEGKVKNFKLGIVGVINKMDPGMTFKQGRKREQELLKKHLNTIAAKHGGQNLIKLLQKCLFTSIKQQLPKIQRDVNNKLKEAEDELKSLGTPITSTESMYYTVGSTVNDVAQRFKDSLVLGSEVDADAEGNELTIRAKIAQICHSVVEKLPRFAMDQEVIMRYVYNARPLNSNLDLPEEAFQRIARKMIEQYEAPVLQLADEVRDELVQLLNICINAGGAQILRLPMLVAAIKAEAQQLLDEQLEVVQKNLSSIFADHRSCIKTSRSEFKDLADKTFQNHPEKSTWTQKQKDHAVYVSVYHLVSKYCGIISEELQDYFLRLVHNRMINETQKSLCDTLLRKFSRLSQDELAVLLDEEEETRMSREALTKFIQAMKEAQKVIMGVKNHFV